MSNTTHDSNLPNNNNEEEQSFDLKEFLGKIITNWKLFLIFLIVSPIAAILYLNIAKPKYEISANILIEMQSSSPGANIGSGMMGGGGALSALTDVSSLLGIPNNANNEVLILQSKSLMTNVVEKMHLNVGVYRHNFIGYSELYKDAPFTVAVRYKFDSLELRKYNVEIKNNIVHIKNSKDAVNIYAKFGDTIKLQRYDLVLNRLSTPVVNGEYVIRIEAVEETVEALSKVLTAELPDKLATVVSLSFKYQNSAKGEAILNELINEYIKADLSDKDQIADSTIAFMDSELKVVGNDLTGIENNLERFKTANKIADISAQSQALITSAADYQKQLGAIDIQLSVIQDLQKRLEDPNNKNIIPASVLAIQDPGFAPAVAQYDALVVARDRETVSSTENNPFLQNINLQLDNFRNDILKTIATYRGSLLVSRKQLDQKNESFNSLLTGVPSKERVFLDYTRQQDLKQALYLFLLQQREETAISKKSTISSSRIIDRAKSEYQIPAKRYEFVALICLLAAFVLPFIIVSIMELLRVRILSKADIEAYTSIPIVGEIGHNQAVDSLVVDKSSRTVISEQFRSLRTNLQFLLKADTPQVIMMTSSMSGEGKSFITANLGSALAITGKKVLLFELDIRKPKLSTSLGNDNQNGFTNYVISSSTDISSIIKQLPFNENCYLISSGPLPPNPSELLLSKKLDEIINSLKKEFDYILIDCAPVGLVSDALIVERFVDVILYVVRQNFTYKSQLNIVNDLKNTTKLRQPYLVVNDIKLTSTGYYGHGYGNGYGHGYGYGNYGQMDSQKRGFFGRIRNVFSKNGKGF